MNRIYKLSISLLMLVFFMSGCIEEELELTPQQSLSSETAFSSLNNAEGTVIGNYHLMQDLDVFGSMPQVTADFMSDNVNFEGSFPTLQDINSYSQLADNGSIAAWWSEAWEVIAGANLTIAGVETVPDASDAEKTALIAEAKFQRALTYFHLVNLFAQPVQVEGGNSLGLPLILDPFEGDPASVNLERSTVEQTHQQIIADLNDAIAGLPDSYGTNTETRGRATSFAARALLSRLRLYRGEWTAASDLANEVINSANYTLASDFTFYNALTPEDVFTLINTDQDNGATGSGGWDSYYNGSNANGRGDATFSQDLINAFQSEPGDLRFELKETGVAAISSSAFFTTKYNDGLTNSSNAPLIRISEMYLNRAEALAEIASPGVSSEAIDLVNEIRERAGLSSYSAADFANGTELVNAILVERRKELAFEGHRRMDLLRKGLPLRTTGTVPATVITGTGGVGVSSPGDTRVIMPIPQNQVDLSEGVLQQNLGY